jgi:nucleotide-binding universal stress UspA family protein
MSAFMPILCGTDFSATSAEAVTVASQLALKMRLPLHLVHAVDLSPDELYGAPKSSLLSLAEAHLRQQTEGLRKSGADVELHIKAGPPDEVLRDLAHELSASLIVVGALGQRRADTWQLGSHADRTAQRSHVPVLVVRNSAPFEAWATGSRPLRIVLGVDASLSSENAGHWISDLAAFGACEVVLAHLYWPPAEFERLGLSGVRSWVEPTAEVTRTLEQEYSERFAALFGATGVTCRLEPHLGRIGDRLAALTTEEKADLVVVGCHDRGPVGRLWEGSVSQRILRCAQTSVACIPAPMQAQGRATPVVRNVLAATDFSKLGNGAIPLAYSIVSHGGTVHLMHVLNASTNPVDAHDIFSPTEGQSELVKVARAGLARLIPNDAGRNAALTRIHVVESSDPMAAICQAAERLDADVICLGTHGRSGPSRLLLGSVAESVVAKTRRPVLLCRGALE